MPHLPQRQGSGFSFDHGISPCLRLGWVWRLGLRAWLLLYTYSCFFVAVGVTYTPCQDMPQIPFALK